MTSAAIPLHSPRMNGRTWGELILLGAIWGGAFFFGRIAVAEFHPLDLVFFRVLLAALALHFFLAATGNPLRLTRRMAINLVILSVLNNVIPFSLIFTGQTVLGAGLASIINATTPFWTAIAAQLLTADEKLTVNKLVGIGLGIGGAAVIVGPSVAGHLDGPAWPKFAILGATVSYALAALFARRLRGMAPAHLAAGQLTSSAAIMLVIVLLTSSSAIHWTSFFDWTGGRPAAAIHLAGISMRAWAAVVALAFVSTAFAYILYFRIIAAAGATNASLVTLIVPASALVLGIAFLGEQPDILELAGLGLIAAGLVTIDGRLVSRR